jgi:crotonobetaine/carnitine-CoA ligase
VLLAHPAVVECAVIGVAAGVEAGEDEVMAVVVLDPAAEVSASELWSFCDGKIPAFAIPRFVRYVDALPTTPSQKVRKAVLRQDGVTAETHDRTAEAVRA